MIKNCLIQRELQADYGFRSQKQILYNSLLYIIKATAMSNLRAPALALKSGTSASPLLKHLLLNP